MWVVTEPETLLTAVSAANSILAIGPQQMHKLFTLSCVAVVMTVYVAQLEIVDGSCTYLAGPAEPTYMPFDD